MWMVHVGRRQMEIIHAKLDLAFALDGRVALRAIGATSWAALHDFASLILEIAVSQISAKAWFVRALRVSGGVLARCWSW